MFRIITLILLLFTTHLGNSQVTINKNLNELTDKNPKYFSFGWANVIPTIASFTNNNTFKETIQFAFNYEEETDTNTYLRFGFAINSTSEKLTTIRNYYFDPLIFSLGLGKKLNVGRDNQLIPYIDLFYTQSLNGARFGSGTWQGNNYGIGLVAGLSYIKPLNDLWDVSFDVNAGGGFFRSFKNIGTRTQMVMVPEFFSTRPLAISLRYHFQ